MTDEVIETFHWEETAAVLAGIRDEHELHLDDKGHCFANDNILVRPPLVLPIVEAGSLDEYLEALVFEPEAHTVILLQAGAAALGSFDAGENRRSKAIKKYVVRGSGKAQPTHLATKGKSRYGSRLRLQNARALLVEVNEKLREWDEEFGAADHVFVNCPVRMWPELFRAKVTPPFTTDRAIIKIPLDLPVPTTRVLLHTYQRMSFGSVVRRVTE